MGLSQSKISRILYIGLFAAVMVSGCTVRFAGRELPSYTNEQLSVPEKRVTASYDAYADSLDMAVFLIQEVKKVLSSSILYADLHKGPAQAAYYYSFVLHDKNKVPASIWIYNNIITMLTLGVIPTYQRYNFVLTVEVREGERVIKTYKYKDHVIEWSQLFLMFLIPSHQPLNITSSVIDNMIMNFAYDFSNDVHSGFYVVQRKD